MISKKQYNDIQEREKQKKIEQLEKYVKTLTESVDAILSQGRTEIYFTELNGGHIFRENATFFLNRLKDLYSSGEWHVELIVQTTSVPVSDVNSYYYDKFGLGYANDYKVTYTGFKFT